MQFTCSPLPCDVDAARLVRLRHPGVDHVVQGLDESKNDMVMVTEPLVASVAESLDVLHSNAHLIHRGAWKLGGFGFTISVGQSSDGSTSIHSFHYPEYDVEDSILPLQPSLDYSALVHVLSSSSGETLLLLGKHAELIINKATKDFLMPHVLPLLVRAFDDTDPHIQEVLRRTVSLARQLDIQLVKQAILPHVHDQE